MFFKRFVFGTDLRQRNVPDRFRFRIAEDLMEDEDRRAVVPLLHLHRLQAQERLAPVVQPASQAGGERVRLEELRLVFRVRVDEFAKFVLIYMEM